MADNLFSSISDTFNDLVSGDIFNQFSGANPASSSSSSSSNMLSDAWKWLTGGSTGANATLGAIGGGLATLLGGDSAPSPTGYQGKIPNYTYNRQMLPHAPDPNRVPGSAGRRYFTDGTFTGGQGEGGMQGGISNVQTQPVVGGNPMQGDQPPVQQFAEGGIASLKKGRFLKGDTDGMADEINTTIDDEVPAKLSHGEFVIPADVVSHLGNGNSEAGAKVLKEMMARVRKERTGNEKQGKEIDPNKHLPA